MVMDFDHLDGHKKVANIAVLVYRHQSLRMVMEEIKKCEVVCSNCHRVRTHKRREANKARGR